MPSARVAIALLLLGTACDRAAPAKTETKAETKTKTETKADAKADATAAPSSWTFDDATPDAVPAGVRIVQTGEPTEPATWATVAEPSAPSPPNAFGVTKTVGTNKTYNLALLEGTSWKDLDLHVALRPTSGTNNQGGGVVFRAKSENDHYVARWNPVEKNFRIYALVNGARVDIKAADLDLDTKQWHVLHVIAQGDSIECFMDDEPIVTATDKTFPEAGMIGLWTKGDAATLFDDLTIAAP
ncbi:MAG TPA: family 16 glycoside hydrolase [Nannocystaceae bacterium]|nr:family 16 glycoside hydrolase [Nannocystaceae bacterium]